MPTKLTESYLRRIVRQELNEIFNMDKISPVISRTYRSITSGDSNFKVKYEDYQDEIRDSNAWKFTVRPLLKRYGNEFRHDITRDLVALSKTGGNILNILPEYRGGADKQIVFPDYVDNQAYALAFLEVISTSHV
jgi:hypothetical protein